MAEMKRYFRKSRRVFYRPAFRRGILILLAAALLAAAAAYRGGTGFDVLRRYLHYGRAKDYAADPIYTYEFSPNNHFMPVGESLVVLSDTRLTLLDRSGYELWSAAVHMSSPALVRGANRAVAYDAGGTELHILDASGEVATLTAAEDEPFLSARLNRNGWLAVTSGKQDFKGAVRVYDADMNLAFEFYSARRFVTDACVTDDNHRVAVVTLGQEESVFVSDIVLYRLNDESAQAETDYMLPDALCMELTQKGQHLLTISDTCITRARTDGEIRNVYDYTGEYLREYDCGGDGYTALLLNRYQSGSVGRLVTVGSDGMETGSIDVREEVLDISAAGRYLAVLYADRLVIYHSSLREYASMEDTGDLRGILMRSDGTVLLLGSSSARLFLP